MASQLERIEKKLDRILNWLEVDDVCHCLENFGSSKGRVQADGKVKCLRCKKIQPEQARDVEGK